MSILWTASPVVDVLIAGKRSGLLLLALAGALADSHVVLCQITDEACSVKPRTKRQIATSRQSTAVSAEKLGLKDSA